jgi:hypothetical protein
MFGIFRRQKSASTQILRVKITKFNRTITSGIYRAKLNKPKNLKKEG